ncbi:hypothetical protein Q7P37_008995 [Cladosporium fusiforme]
MHAKIITFAAGALFALGNAVPLNNGKRDIVWVTEIETAVETVGVTTTLWVDPTPTASQPKDNKPKENKHYGHRSQHHKQEQDAQSTVEVKPTPSPEPSSTPEAAEPTEPAPAPSSYEAPAAPSPEAPSSSAPEPSSPAKVEQPATTEQAAPATTQAPATPSSTYEAPAPSSSAAAPASYSSDSSSSSSGSSSGNPASGQSFTGELTYFTPGMGACGHTSNESEKMVAVSEALFDSYTTGGNPNNNPLCGKTLTIKGADGADHKATIWDRCPGCAEADLDLPQEFFNAVTMKDGKPADGRAHGIEWSMD